MIGLDFLVTEIPREVFCYSDGEPMQYVEANTNTYPYLLVNIGSGVSMIKVGKDQYQRIGGTSLGGGTFWGLMSLLTGESTFDDMLSMADRGDNASVDLLVGDIYGMGYENIGLKNTAIASSFGKVYKTKRQGETQGEDFGISDSDHTEQRPQPAEQRNFDFSRSLLLAIRYACRRSSLVSTDSLSATTSDRLLSFSRRSMLSTGSTSGAPL